LPFDPARLRAFKSTTLGRFLAALPIDWFHATLEDGARIPREGGALLVGNHAFTGVDGVVLGALVEKETGQHPRFLGERNLWRVPGLGSLLTSMGAIPGEPEAATELLRSGELVIVYPGGVDDSFKTADERYVLKWGARRGFAKVAMRAKVPIVPVAAFGIDHMYTVAFRERWIGRRLLGSPRYDIPIAFGAFGSLVPRRVPQRYAVQEIVDTSGDPDDDDAVELVRSRTHEVLQNALKTAPR
jgi:1-acyl-sn-glycerol-3-phosphate acyltransferase